MIKPNVNTFNDTVDLELNINEKIKVVKHYINQDGKEEEIPIFTGRVLTTNSRHFTLLNKRGIRESFMYADIIDERFKIKKFDSKGGN